MNAYVKKNRRTNKQLSTAQVSFGSFSKRTSIRVCVRAFTNYGEETIIHNVEMLNYGES